MVIVFRALYEHYTLNVLCILANVFSAVPIKYNDYLTLVMVTQEHG
jgi:hypothetical protein